LGQLPHHLVCEVVHDGENNRVGCRNDELAALGGQRQENARGQHKEEHSNVDKHYDVHCILNREIFMLVPQF